MYSATKYFDKEQIEVTQPTPLLFLGGDDKIKHSLNFIRGGALAANTQFRIFLT
jgi:hypothetical protein